MIQPTLKRATTCLAVLAGIILAGCVRQQLSRPDPSGNSGNTNITVSDDVQAGQVAVINIDIIVTQPVSNASITSPLEVSGRSNVDDATIVFRLRDDRGAVIVTAELAPNGEAWGSFKGQLSFKQPQTPVGSLEVFSLNPENQAEENFIILPVQFAQYVSPVAQLYFSNSQKDPEFLFCDRVYAVNRKLSYIRDVNILAQILNQLLAGPTEAEVSEGYFSNFSTSTTQVQNVTIASSTLTIDFSTALKNVTQACEIAGIGAQVTETFKQFQNIDDVVITIDGELDEAFPSTLEQPSE